MVSTGVQSYARLISQASGIKVKAVETLPGGAAIASLAHVHLSRGETDDALSLTPLYLKESTARVFVNKYSKK